MLSPRWAGVPFVMKAGKALNERKVEIRVQYKPPAAGIHGGSLNEMRNELVVRSTRVRYCREQVACPAGACHMKAVQAGSSGSKYALCSVCGVWHWHECAHAGTCCAGSQMRVQPDEAIYMKTVVKKPGLEMDAIMSEMDLSYKQRYSGTYIPDAYERLLLDALRGDQQHFVRRCEPWCIVCPCSTTAVEF